MARGPLYFTTAGSAVNVMNKKVNIGILLPPPSQDHIYRMLNSDIMETESAERKIGQDIK